PRASRACNPEQRFQCSLREHHSGVRLPERDPARGNLAPELTQVFHIEQPMLDPARGEYVTRGQLDARAELDEAVQPEQLPSGLALERTPATECLLGELHARPIRIRETHHP